MTVKAKGRWLRALLTLGIALSTPLSSKATTSCERILDPWVERPAPFAIEISDLVLRALHLTPSADPEVTRQNVSFLRRLNTMLPLLSTLMGFYLFMSQEERDAKIDEVVGPIDQGIVQPLSIATSSRHSLEESYVARLVAEVERLTKMPIPEALRESYQARAAQMSRRELIYFNLK